MTVASVGLPAAGLVGRALCERPEQLTAELVDGQAGRHYGRRHDLVVVAAELLYGSSLRLRIPANVRLTGHPYIYRYVLPAFDIHADHLH
ncbi:MAG: hypothetical protein IT189_11990 [Microbacteriaceae bacterium]|jgi:hypothetical protein|uniref:hypothetical protein n=1 Tax=Propionibacterium freudenreichii TaxID=1744 RepID=UPI0012FD80F6|nr:hypothetical protein [Propionibacterium freudenreichii]MCC6856765.1 hypothetical protein [Microbacteriaceae bacterium]